MNECFTIREWLPAYIDDELAPAQVEQAERHLEACSDCRQELEALDRDTMLLKATVGAPVAVNDRITDAVWAQIEAEDREAARAASAAQPAPRVVAHSGRGVSIRERLGIGALGRQWAFAGGLAGAVAVMLLMFSLFQNSSGSRMDMQIASVVGNPLWRASEAGAWQPLSAGALLPAGAAVRTGDADRITATWKDGSQAILGPDGEGIVLRLFPGMEIKQGKVWAKIQKQEKAPFTLRTPHATAQVMGTELALEVPEAANRTVLVVMEGAVQFFNTSGSVTAGSWSRTEAAAGVSPTTPVPVSPLSQDSMWWVR